jgi:chromosome segregation ATPase
MMRTLTAVTSAVATVVPWWVQVMLAAVPLAGAYLAYRQATKATRATKDVESTKVDAEAYLTAKKFYEDMLAERKSQSLAQQEQIGQLNAQVQELQKSLNEIQAQLNIRLGTEGQLRDQIAKLIVELGMCTERGEQLHRRVKQLEGSIRDSGDQPPPAPDLT